jgi:hypothetical protein
VPRDPNNPDFFLPDELEISFEDFEETYDVWVKWRATDRRFLPTELRRQPEPLMSNILYLDSIFEKMVGQVMERYKEQQGNG